MIARILHGFGARDRIPAHRCCGRRWRDLPRHRQFVHGEEAVGQILEGTLTPEGWQVTEIDPLASCPRCGYAEGAHDEYGCPSEARTQDWWGR